MSDTFIHYGTTSFDPDSFMPIKNEVCFTKPSGGLWASPADAARSWKDWCRDVSWPCEEEISFSFTMKESANVLRIKSAESLKDLPKIELEFLSFRPSWECLDFEQLRHEGVDAILVYISEDYRLNRMLYGWDCDSILVMNKDIIII